MWQRKLSSKCTFYPHLWYLIYENAWPVVLDKLIHKTYNPHRDPITSIPPMFRRQQRVDWLKLSLVSASEVFVCFFSVHLQYTGIVSPGCLTCLCVWRKCKFTQWMDTEKILTNCIQELGRPWIKPMGKKDSYFKNPLEMTYRIQIMPDTAHVWNECILFQPWAKQSLFKYM